MINRHRPLSTILVLIVLFGTARAEDTASRSPKEAKSRRSSEVSAEQEREVVGFLRQHHADLADLLEHLQSSSPPAYHNAIRDLWKTRERLMQIKKLDDTRFALELDAWRLQSNIQLLVARLAIKDDVTQRDQLRSLLSQQVDLKIKLLIDERERHAERLRRLDEQIEQHKADRTETIEKQFVLLTNGSKRLKQKSAEITAKKRLHPPVRNPRDIQPQELENRN